MNTLQIKKKAKREILKVMSEEDQRNSLAEMVVILYTIITDPATASDPLVVEAANKNINAWKKVGDIRSVSNRKEAGESVVWPI